MGWIDDMNQLCRAGYFLKNKLYLYWGGLGTLHYFGSHPSTSYMSAIDHIVQCTLNFEY